MSQLVYTYTPTSYHFSFFLLCDQTSHLKSFPLMVLLTIGTMFKGAIDDVDVILETLKECGYSQDRFYIHCDAALCGLMTPFINNVSFNCFLLLTNSQVILKAIF